ncbi:MAG: hypothetical protein GY751_22545 [Bacteroidetes bacterium]|nr:hypothetical protein [Bacteroidota bacterium]
MMIRIIPTIVLVLVFLALPAQEENGAFGGGNGIFVFLNGGLYSPEQPDNGLATVTIERKAESEGNWKEIATVSSPGNERAFSSKLNSALEEMPYEVDFLKDKDSQIWQSVSTWNKDPEEGGFLVYLPVQIAAGMAYLDRSATRGVMYTYRLIRKDASGGEIDQLEFHPVSYPKPLTDLSFAYESHENDGVGLALKFSGPTSQFPSVVQLYRKDEIDGEFKKVEAHYSIQSSEDKSFVTVLDEQAGQRKLYEYELRPMDQFGNTGSAEGSPVIGNYDFQRHAPVLMMLRTSESPNGIGTMLQWEYHNYDLAAAVRILRSEDIGGPFEAIAEVPRNTVSYMDQTIRPMNGFYYQIQVLGPLGEEAAPGTPVRAYFEDAANSVAPVLKASAGEEGIDLEVVIKDLHIGGVRIYRSTSLDEDMVLVSGLLPAEKQLVKWTDDKVGSDHNVFYYTATAVSTSHQPSTFSDPVFVEWMGSRTKELLHQAPGNLEVSDNGKSIALYWDNIRSGAEIVRYAVLRKTDDETDYTNLTPDLLTYSNYTDKGTDLTATYEYAVIAIYPNGVMSEVSDPVTVSRKGLLPVSPSGIRALQLSEGVQLEWNEVADEKVAGYRVYRYERGGKPILISTIASDGKLQYIDRNVQEGSLYFYFVRSVDAAGKQGSASAEASVRIR